MKGKRWMTLLCCGIMTFLAAGCNFGGGTQEEEVDLDTPKYDLERYMTPIWEGNVVYNESVCLLLNEQGDFDLKTLLYDATEIVSVRSGKLDKRYIEGQDYSLENGKLKLNKDSGYLKIAYNDYYIKYEPSGEKLVRASKEGVWLYYTEGSWFHERQIAVTYKHNSTFDPAYIPQSKGDKLSKVHAKLAAKEPVNIVLYGASNDTGCNSSSFVNCAPFAPTYPEMMEAQLRKDYGYDQITIDNSLSVGGMASDYGVAQLDNLVAKNPDLVIICFGINDAYYRSVEEYAVNMKTMVERIKEDCPQSDIILAHGPYTNPEVGRAKEWSHLDTYNVLLDKYGVELYKLEENGVVVADLCKIDGYVLTRKQFADMTANNINHNNDFKARMVAQTLIKTMKIEK